MSIFGGLLEFLIINSSHAIERLLNSSAMITLFVHSLCMIPNFRQSTRIERAACLSESLCSSGAQRTPRLPAQWYEACFVPQCLLVP